MVSFAGDFRRIERHWCYNSFPGTMDSRVGRRAKEKQKYREQAWRTEPNLLRGCVIRQQARVGGDQSHYCFRDETLQGPAAQVADRKVIREGAVAAPQGVQLYHSQRALLNIVAVEICKGEVRW